MPLKELKKELVSFIENTNDEEILSLLIEDFMFYAKEKNIYETGSIDDEERKGLKVLSQEDNVNVNDVGTQEEVNRAPARSYNN